MTDTKKRVLIVEDDLVLADVLSNKLKLEDYDVSTAPDGQVAIDLLNTEVYGVVLLDLSMPWFDGFHVLEELKKKGFKTPIIIMSNLAGVEDINKAKSLGAADYLVKTSVTPELIVKEIQKYLK
jgi:two-component system, OmpR family, response regulator